MRAATPFVVAVVLAAGCGQILDIEEAHLVSSAGAGGVNEAGAPTTPSAGGAETTSAAGGQKDAGGAETAGRANTGGSAEGGDPGRPRTDHPPSLCDQYCSAMAADCSGKDAQYIDADACHQACRLFPAGTPGDTEGNTLDCRLTYANKAHSERYTYCTWAGPGGDGKCGANCEGFCTLMMTACTAASTGPGHVYFDSQQDCLTSCEKLADVGAYSSSDKSLQRGADHVQCRLYHVNAALAEDDSFTHCPHAFGATLCVGAPSELEASRP